MLNMNAQLSRPGWNLETPISPELAAVVAYGMVVLVFLGDWFTPAAVVIALGYEAPVLFAALKGTQRLTTLTIVLASFGIGLGWLIDLAQASFQFSDTRIANRIFSLISVWIVGALALLIQRSAERTESLGLERSLRRENALSSGMDRVISALSPGTTVQALIGAAPQMLEAPAAVWCSTQPGGAFWLAVRGAPEATTLAPKAPGSFDELLLARLRTQRSVEIVAAAETIDYLTGKTYGSKNALAIPIGDGSEIVGVVFAAITSPRIEDRALIEAENFAKFATTAMRAHQANQQLVHAKAAQA
jgi:hypothetical protein